jgi:hypothetical protein
MTILALFLFYLAGWVQAEHGLNSKRDDPESNTTAATIFALKVQPSPYI